MALSSLGHIEDALVSYCLSASLNKTLSSYSSNNRQEIAKVCNISYE